MVSITVAMGVAIGNRTRVADAAVGCEAWRGDRDAPGRGLQQTVPQSSTDPSLDYG